MVDEGDGAVDGRSSAPDPSGWKASPEPISFSEFVMSIGMNAMGMLQSDGDLVSSKADLLQASQHIDILRMLKEKTSGRLDDEEQKLIESLIYDLQMRYLEVSRQQP